MIFGRNPDLPFEQRFPRLAGHLDAAPERRSAFFERFPMLADRLQNNSNRLQNVGAALLFSRTRNDLSDNLMNAFMYGGQLDDQARERRQQEEERQQQTDAAIQLWGQLPDLPVDAQLAISALGPQGASQYALGRLLPQDAAGIEPTDDMREYQYYVQQAQAAGETPMPFAQWMGQGGPSNAEPPEMQQFYNPDTGQMEWRAWVGDQWVTQGIAEAPPAAQPGFRPLTDPGERAAFGIPATDTAPYQIGPDNRIYSISGGQSVTVTTPPGESRYQSDRGAQDAAVYGEIRDAGREAVGTLATLERMEQLVSDPAFYSGAGAGLVQTFRQGIAALGGDPNAAAPMEEFTALANRAALDAMGGSLGTGFSNADRDFVTEMVPSLASTPEGNLARIEVLRRINERKIQIAQMAGEYEREHGRLDFGFDQMLAEWVEANPLFADMATSGQSGATGQPLPAGNYTWTPDAGLQQAQ